MTLEEAIAHCDEEVRKECDLGRHACADEHRQLRNWLIELRDIKNNSKTSTIHLIE